MTQNEQYWIDRANRRMDNYTLSAIEQARIIQRSYNEMLNYVESEIAKILRHTGGPDTLAYEYRIKRLNVLLAKTEARMQELYGVNLIGTTEFLKRIIPEAYYHTIFDIAQGVGLEPTFAAVPTRLIDKILNEDWSGENYSKRIWSNTNKLAGDLRQVLTEAAMTGESIQKTSRKLSEAFATTNYNSRRLIRTETTYSCNQAELLAYGELDIEKYEFVATLDTRTSPICQEQDGKIYELKEAKAGVNLPAMHPNCRSTTIPYFEDGMPTVRAARDENGKRIKVPASMKYDEWYKKYVEPKEKNQKPRKLAAPAKGKPVEVPAAAPAEISMPQEGSGVYTDVKIPERSK